jgi:integrative and conjugative element protein (TIGR02256 family)
LKSNWKLIYDPRTGIEFTDERYRGFSWWSLGALKECFIWRGEIKVSHAKPGKKLETTYWTIDFIYPSTYPYDRIFVRVISPRLEATRHIFGHPPHRDLLCYMPYSPNAWTTGTINTEVIERVRNWFRGYLSGWQHGEHIELPEPLSHVQYSGYDVYLLDQLYQKGEKPGYGFLSLETKSPKGAISKGVAVSHTLKDLANDCELASSSPLSQAFLDIVLLEGKTPRTFEVAWLDLNEELPFITSTQLLFDAIARAWPRSHSRFQSWWSGVLNAARCANQPLWLLVRFLTPGSAYQWVGYLMWPRQQLHPECGGLSIAVQGDLVGVDHLPQSWRKLVQAQSPFIHEKFRSLRLLPTRQRDLFRRSEGLPYEASQLHNKRVTIIGCGALGSPAFALLARSGVGNFTLADGDDLMHWNVMRHELTLHSVRTSKTLGLWHLLADINPYASARRVGYLRDAKAIAEAIQDADIVLVAVADDALEEQINQVALALGKPAIYARGLAQMEVGRVHRVLPGQDACFVCLHAHAQGYGTPQSDTWLAVEASAGDLIYDEGCGMAAVPGAGVDTQAIGNLLARRALDVLLEHNTAENHWVLVNRAQPHARDARLWQEATARAMLLEPVEGCPCCGAQQSHIHREGIVLSASPRNLQPQRAKDGKTFKRVEIHETVFDLVRSESASYGRLETGGVLMGYVDTRRETLVVTGATDAGPHAKHGRTSFAKDVAYCQNAVDAWATQSERSEDYIGEWHRHPCLSTFPSPTDRASLTGIAASAAYHLTQPVMLIFGLPDHRRPETFAVEVHSFVDGQTETMVLPWSVLKC